MDSLTFRTSGTHVRFVAPGSATRVASKLQLRAGQRVAVLDAPPDVAIGVPAGVSRVDDPA